MGKRFVGHENRLFNENTRKAQEVITLCGEDCVCESRPCVNEEWTIEDDFSEYVDEIIFPLGFTVIMLLVFSLVVVFV